ncbi:MAG: hypothetical protein ABFD12_12685 [Syntrophorhabdus sp.]
MRSIMTGYQPSVPLARSGTGRTIDSDDADREKVCKEFESFMLYSMLKYMEKTTNMSPKQGYAEESYMAIVYEKVADFLAEKGVGIKEMLMKYTDKENISKVIPPIRDNEDK